MAFLWKCWIFICSATLLSRFLFFVNCSLRGTWFGFFRMRPHQTGQQQLEFILMRLHVYLSWGKKTIMSVKKFFSLNENKWESKVGKIYRKRIKPCSLSLETIHMVLQINDISLTSSWRGKQTYFCFNAKWIKFISSVLFWDRGQRFCHLIAARHLFPVEWISKCILNIKLLRQL